MLKYLKSYNESLRDKMKPKSDEEILKDLGKLSPEEMLLTSIKNNYVNGVKKALERGVNINKKNERDYNRTALLYASIYGYKNIVEILLKNGADINIQDVNGWTALIFASNHGHKDIVEILLKNGADVNKKIFNGETALMSASNKGYKEIVELLLKHGADINITNKFGYTALYYASLKKYKALIKEYKEIIELLKKYGAKE